METVVESLCTCLPRLGRKERAYVLGYAQGLAGRHQREEREER